MIDKFVKVRNNRSLAVEVVEELTDKMFAEGWRFVELVETSKVDYPGWLGKEQDKADKANNEPVHRQPNLSEVSKYYEDIRKQEARKAKELRLMLGVRKFNYQVFHSTEWLKFI